MSLVKKAENEPTTTSARTSRYREEAEKRSGDGESGGTRSVSGITRPEKNMYGMRRGCKTI